MGYKSNMSQVSYIIIAAIALFFIFEGFLPFVSPGLWRRIMHYAADRSDKTLHIIGFISMLIGVILLIFAHYYVL
ncbi:MAG: DUF2065 domain-containing protein [Pseudomonadota bacterium]